MIFLVNSVALVDQQHDSLNNTSGFKCAKFCGADGVDDWSKETWKSKLQGQQIVVFVHQVFLDILNRGYVSFDDIALIVIDEIHHTRKKHPYNQVMMRYLENKEKGSKVPQILGLTASIVTEKCNQIKFIKLKTELESNTDSSVVTTDNLASILK